MNPLNLRCRPGSIRRRGIGALVLVAMALVCFARAAGPDLQLAVLHPEAAAVWTVDDDLAVQVRLRHPVVRDETAGEEQIVVAPANRPWAETVSLQVANAAGQTVSWPWVASGPSGLEPLELDVEGAASMTFALNLAAKPVMTPGTYTLTARMDVSDGTGWIGHAVSPPLSLVVGTPAPVEAGIAVSLRGEAALAAGDPWVVSVQLQPPLGTTAESALRSGYRFRVFDAGQEELAWTFDPAIGPPDFPGAAELAERGFGPVMAVLPPASAPGIAAGIYRLEVSWADPVSGQSRTNAVDVTVNAPASVAAHPARWSAVLGQKLAWATTLLWRAEVAPTADLDGLTRQAAPLLLAAQTGGLENFAANPESRDWALFLAETFLASGDVASARAFRTLAEERHAPDPGLIEFAPDPGFEELAQVGQLIEETASAPGRAVPFLIPALAAIRPPDTTAQWAATARASSEYRATDYGAGQATGAPNVTRHGDNARAWASKAADAGEEWIELTYAAAVSARGVRVVQSFNPGAISRIDLLPVTGAAITVWRGPDPTTYPKGEIGTLEVTFAPPPVPVNGVRVVLDTRLVAGWNEIDAAQLLAVRPAVGPPRLAYVVLPGTPAVIEFSPWPAGYLLQRASRLAPADWVSPPVGNPPRFNLDGPTAFFRLIKVP